MVSLFVTPSCLFFGRQLGCSLVDCRPNLGSEVASETVVSFFVGPSCLFRAIETVVFCFVERPVC